jgi:hypothetical protein
MVHGRHAVSSCTRALCSLVSYGTVSFSHLRRTPERLQLHQLRTSHRIEKYLRSIATEETSAARHTTFAGIHAAFAREQREDESDCVCWQRIGVCPLSIRNNTALIEAKDVSSLRYVENL